MVTFHEIFLWATEENNMKITKWEFGLMWSLIMYATLMLSDTEFTSNNIGTFLFLFWIIPIIIALSYITWIYPLSIIFRDMGKKNAHKKTQAHKK